MFFKILNHLYLNIIKNFLKAYHFVIDFVEVDFTDFVHNILVLIDDEAEAAMSVGLLVEHQHHILNLYQRNCQLVSKSLDLNDMT